MKQMVAMLVILGALANTTRAQPTLTVKDYDDFYSNVILEAKNGSKTEWLVKDRGIWRAVRDVIKAR